MLKKLAEIILSPTTRCGRVSYNTAFTILLQITNDVVFPKIRNLVSSGVFGEGLEKGEDLEGPRGS